jgi:uncharacterized protein YdhG (YjbR/CyaY superfamily)
MAEKATKKTTVRKAADTFTAEEKAAMQDLAEERKASKRGASREADEKAMLEKIAELSDGDRKMAERLHEIVMQAAPDLAPKTWYGMPAWNKDGKAVCFFTPAEKFKERYASFGFNSGAALDDGSMWPTAFALLKLDEAAEKRIAALVKQAAG